MPEAYMMMVSAHCEHTEKIDPETHSTDKQQLACIHFRRVHPIAESATSTKLDQERAHSRSTASNTMKIEMRNTHHHSLCATRIEVGHIHPIRYAW